jgi:hypothetical protein
MDAPLLYHQTIRRPSFLTSRRAPCNSRKKCATAGRVEFRPRVHRNGLRADEVRCVFFRNVVMSQLGICGRIVLADTPDSLRRRPTVASSGTEVCGNPTASNLSSGAWKCSFTGSSDGRSLLQKWTCSWPLARISLLSACQGASYVLEVVPFPQLRQSQSCLTVAKASNNCRCHG